MVRPGRETRLPGTGLGDGPSAQRSKSRRQNRLGRSTGGEKVDPPDDFLHSSALSLTEAQTLAEVSRKYSTRWVDIQEKLLSLQGKDAIRMGGVGQAVFGAPRQVAEGKEINFPLEHRPRKLSTPSTWALGGQVS